MGLNPSAKRRLNLFAFPPETDALFALLIVAAVMLAAQLSFFLLYLFGPENLHALESLDTGAMLRGEILTETLTTLVTLFSIPVLLVSIIFGVALFIYRGHPRRVRRRKQLEPLSEKDAPLQAAVHDLAAHAGVTPCPAVEMPRGLKGHSGQALGFRDNYRMRLDGGLRAWRRLKQNWFRAIVLHELAHIANGDVGRSYFAEALWTAIITLSIGPLVLGIGSIIARGLLTGLLRDGVAGYLEVLRTGLPIAFELFLKTGMIVIVVAMIRARLLRIREIYADWRAALWGAEASLKEIFQESAENEKAPTINPWRLHPTSAERLAALNQPSHLFRLSWELPFMVGFLLAFVLGGVLFLTPVLFILLLEPIRVMRVELGQLYQASPSLLTGPLFWLARGIWFLLFFTGIILVFAPMAWLVSGVLGVQLQKQTVADLTEGRRGLVEYLKLSVPAMLLTLGIEVGFLATPYTLFTPEDLAGLMVEIIMLGITVLLAWLFLAYARFITIRLFVNYVGAKRPVWRTRLGAWALNGWLFFLFIPALILNRYLTWNASLSNWLPYLLIGLVVPIGVAAILVPIAIVAGWGAIKISFGLRPPRCPTCGQVTHSATPAIQSCKHCQHSLGDWLFAPEEGWQND